MAVDKPWYEGTQRLKATSCWETLDPDIDVDFTLSDKNYLNKLVVLVLWWWWGFMSFDRFHNNIMHHAAKIVFEV